MKKALVIVIALLLCSITVIKGQSSLGIDSIAYSIKDTTFFGSVDTYSVNIVNFGPQAFTGNINMSYAVDTSGSGLNSLDSSQTLSNITIPVGNQLPATTTISISPSAYRSGINTVVIWPRSSTGSFTTHDSLKVPVWVIGAVGISESSGQNKPILFPNPAMQTLFVANRDPNFIIEQVRVFDASGQLVNSEKFKGSMDVSKFAPGTYTVEFTDKEGRALRYKIVRAQ